MMIAAISAVSRKVMRNVSPMARPMSLSFSSLQSSPSAGIDVISGEMGALVAIMIGSSGEGMGDDRGAGGAKGEGEAMGGVGSSGEGMGDDEGVGGVKEAIDEVGSSGGGMGDDEGAGGVKEAIDEVGSSGGGMGDDEGAGADVEGEGEREAIGEGDGDGGVASSIVTSVMGLFAAISKEAMKLIPETCSLNIFLSSSISLLVKRVMGTPILSCPAGNEIGNLCSPLIVA